MDPSISSARIPDPASGVAFLQVWDTDSAAAQSAWFQDMSVNVHLLRAKPGFVSMTLHRSLDQKSLCVYAQWTSQTHLGSAVIDPYVQGARAKLDRWARPDGRPYTFHSLATPTASRGAVMEIRADHAISFVNIWECGGSGRQKSLLAALREKSAVIAACDGFVGMALHASLDGTRAASYARWRNLAALQEAVKDNSVVR